MGDIANVCGSSKVSVSIILFLLDICCFSTRLKRHVIRRHSNCRIIVPRFFDRIWSAIILVSHGNSWDVNHGASRGMGQLVVCSWCHDHFFRWMLLWPARFCDWNWSFWGTWSCVAGYKKIFLWNRGNWFPSKACTVNLADRTVFL